MEFEKRKEAEAEDLQSMVELTSEHFRYAGSLKPFCGDQTVCVPVTEEQREYLTYKNDLRFYLSSGSFDLSYLKRKYERYINEWTKPLIAEGQAAYCPVRIRQQATKDMIDEVEREKELTVEKTFEEMSAELDRTRRLCQRLRKEHSNDNR